MGFNRYIYVIILLISSLKLSISFSNRIHTGKSYRLIKFPGYNLKVVNNHSPEDLWVLRLQYGHGLLINQHFLAKEGVSK